MTIVSNSTILGAAGEHYVMCQLLRRNMIAALAPAGVPNADIVVTDTIGDRMSAIQVKTRRDLGTDRGWHMKAKHELLVSPSLFYAFVDFGRELSDAPKCWLVPAPTVADVLKRSHAYWLATPGQKGQARRDSDFRRLLPDYSRTGIEIGCNEGWLNPYFEEWGPIRAASDV
ncbi:hypothetical protein [Shinella sp.]|uniref:hypothetical protein n=1 Tax=Shinella sp. TaxID=1870904 RepID=UPI0028AB5C71|nr:hypothetical protein [Shinella sp.]